MGLLLIAGPAAPAFAAEFGIASGGFSVRTLDAGGVPENRAGSHPDRLQIDFALETEGTGTSLKDLAVEMPPGLGGDPSAVPPCPRQAHEEGEECPPSSQVGTVSFGSAGESLPIFLLEAEPGQVAAFTSSAGLPIPFELKLRSEDFGITFSAEDLAEGAPSEAHIELWGVPADHQAEPAAEARPFLTLPSTCGPLEFTLRARSREEGAAWLSESTETGPLTGCEGLPFSPGFGLRLSTPVADSPTGVGMTLSMPAEAGGELAAAQMRDVSVDLPPGLTVSPGGAAGLAICSDAQFGLGNEAEAACPPAARVGTVELSSSALPEPLVGSVYLGEQRGGERFRLFIAAPGPGLVFKFVTALQPDSDSGLLTATLHDLPQVAIDRIALSLSGGPAGLLAAPLACGPTAGRARFVPYGGGPAVTSTATVSIAAALPGQACPGPLPFAPQLLVSAPNHRAGRATAFSAVLHRRAGEGLPAQFSLTLPAGLSAALGTVDTCPDAIAAAGNCPAASRVGAVRAEVGSGSSPAVLSGVAYLAGPYHRAPFSLVLALAAKVGPFDLGTVAFRATARIDGASGRVTVATERLPSVVAGVPIRFQTIAISLDRPGLVRNPTSCGPHALDATLASQEGGTAVLSSPFEVEGCRRLGFAPRLRATLLRRGKLHAHDSVGLRVSVRFRRGDTALRGLALSLPPALKLGIGGLKQICSRPDARRNLCPPGSRVGTSQARTPLLDRPLNGSIYVVQPRGNGEPDLWVSLSGGGIEL
ncbi:MAG TPA: hypothetical protein VJQ84_11060, partial [Solirubrobacterales bacterium]|nr:hypothetical protein [Solirubrobacterales bacterium]